MILRGKKTALTYKEPGIYFQAPYIRQAARM